MHGTKYDSKILWINFIPLGYQSKVITDDDLKYSFFVKTLDKIRYIRCSLLLKIHIQVIMLQAKNLQLILLNLCNSSNWVEISYLLFWVLSPPN